VCLDVFNHNIPLAIGGIQMARTEVINADPYCTVDLEPVEGLKNMNVVRLFNPDTQTMEPIAGKGAIHAEGYKLVTNEKVHQLVQDVLTRSDQPFEPMPGLTGSKTGIHTWDGKRFSARWMLPNVRSRVTDPGATEAARNVPMHLGVEAINSYDGSCKVGIQFFAMSMACNNQFYSQNLLGGFTFRHYERSGEGTLDSDIDDAMGLIGQAAERFIDVAPLLQKMADTPLSQMGGENATNLDGYLAVRSELAGTWKPSYDPYVLDEMSNTGVTKALGASAQTAHCNNMWGLLNAYTAVSTHKIGGFNGVNLGRIATDSFVGWTKAA
jgi:hypothetical protein